MQDTTALATELARQNAQTARTLRLIQGGLDSLRCELHRAYEPSNCPLCGTAAVIGGHA
jgi:hypothetical protein